MAVKYLHGHKKRKMKKKVYTFLIKNHLYMLD